MSSPEWAALWRGRRRFVVLDTACGNADRFLQAWLAWLDDPGRSAALTFIAIDPEPPTRASLAASQHGARLAPLANELARSWPAPTPDLHLMAFADGRVRLQLAVGTVASWLPRIEAQVDAFVVSDGAEAEGGVAGPDLRFYKRLARIAAPGACLMARAGHGAVADDAEPLHRDLRTAGFEPIGLSSVDEPPGVGRLVARFEPRFKVRPKPQRSGLALDAAAPAHAIVVGAGLAGCAMAWALAQQGVGSTLLERRSQIAAAGSGNAAGLFHGVVHRDDARHARFNRAAALDAHRQVCVAIHRHAVAGHAEGLLRLQTAVNATAADMAATLDRLRLPSDHVRAVSAAEASVLAGIELTHPAWFFPGGGWVDPRGLSTSYLQRARQLLSSESMLELRLDVEVGSVRRCKSEWQALDRSGAVIASAPLLVLANAGDALRLLGSPDWPIECLRGQVSAFDAAALPAESAPRLPITGSGYLLPPIDGKVWFGAASSRDDADDSVRFDDHARNVQRLGGLLPGAVALDAAAWTGRAGFRWSSRDRLPIAGAVPQSALSGKTNGETNSGANGDPDGDPDGDAVGNPDGDAVSHLTSHQSEPVRATPRVAGLFVCTCLGSRGIAWSGLCAQVVAAQVVGAAAPLPADLLDAIDPARFASRARRRAEGGSNQKRAAPSVA